MTVLDLQVGVSAGDSQMTSVSNDSGRTSTVSGICTTADTIIKPGSHGSNDEWWVAARFSNVTIDQGATINSATFTLTAQATYASGGTVSLVVAAHDADNAGALTTSSGDLNNTTRPQTTADSGAWVVNSVTVDVEYSVTVTSVIQGVIDRASWANGNAIVLLICTNAATTLGEWQDFQSYDGSTTKAPKLSIDYGAGGGGGLVRRLVGYDTNALASLVG